MFYTNSVKIPLARLKALSNILKKISEQKASKNLQENEILTAKLAPDMFDFSLQIKLVVGEALQMAETFTAKKSEISLPENPNFSDLEKYILDAIHFLEKISENDIVSAPNEAFATFFWAPNKKSVGEKYLLIWALPNFFFHLTTAYNILRNLGFDLGKGDFIGEDFLEDL